MKRFKFKYENILKLRIDHEDDVKQQLKEANLELARLESVKLKRMQSYGDYKAYVETLLNTGARGNQLQEITRAQKYYRTKIESDEEAIRRQQSVIERIKIDLTEAIKERKIMEKLKEKANEVYYEEAKVYEAKETDEVVNFQNSKRSGD